MESPGILVVEDEVIIAEHLCDILRSAGYKKITMVHDSRSAIKRLTSEDFDLAFLDIRMDRELAGIQIAKIIREKYGFSYIFITAHSDPSIMQLALDTEPGSYITKPFKKSDVLAATQIVLASKRQEQTHLMIRDGWQDVRIPLNRIMYVQSAGNYIDLYCVNKHYSIRNTLNWFIKSVPKNQFCRVHRSTVVNLDYITGITRKSLQLNEVEIPISRSKYQDIIALINK